VEGLGVVEAHLGADGRVPGADPALQVGVVGDLAGVGAQGGQLGVDGGGHLDQLVGGVGAEQQHGVGPMGGRPLGGRLAGGVRLEGSGEPRRGAPVNREGSGEPQGGAPVGGEALPEGCLGGNPVERVAGGDDAVDGEQPGGAVVGVEQPAAPGVVAQDHVRPHGPDQAGHGQPQGHGDLELAVDRPQEVDARRPKGGRGRLRLGPPHRGQGVRVGRRVGAALLAGGEARQLHVHTLAGPGGQGAAGLELDVVRVGAEGQRPPDGQH
jgi:hypothetical protein